MVAHSSVLERILRPSEGDLPAAFARQLLAADFSPTDRARYLELSEKSQLGQLTAEEKAQLDDLLTADDVLAILRAKATSSLKNSRD
jgi:hypothetical protein